jgi:enoyl-CoA hydratase/carnithine racemase
MPASASPVTVAVHGRTAVITMQRPPVNAVDLALIGAIHDAWRNADKDAGVRAMVLTSALEQTFSAGMDLRMIIDPAGPGIRRFLEKFYLETLDIQYRLSKPTIAAVNGRARGAGITLSITSDMIVAAEDTDLGYSEIDIGIIPAIHFVHLPLQVGRHKAFELLFTGKPFSAREAARIGLVNHAVPSAEVLPKALELAEVLAGKPPEVMRLGRLSYLRANDLDFRRNIENQVETMCNVFATAAAKEGIAAFLEKRKPRW